MADAQTSNAVNDNMLMVYLQRKLVRTLEEKVWFYQLGEKYPLPAQSGTQMTFNAWRRIAPASSTLAEQTANDATALSSRRVNVTIASYGRHVKISDLTEKTLIASPQQGAIDRLMQAAALTLDNVCQLAIFKNVLSQVGLDGNRSTILSGFVSARPSSFCANTGTSGNSNQFGFPAISPITGTRLTTVSGTAPSISARFGPVVIRKGYNRLAKFSAEPFADGYFVGVAHPNTITTGFSNALMRDWQINFAEGVKESMWKGTVTHPAFGIRFIVSPNVPRYAVAARSVSLTPVLSQGAFGVTELGGGVEMIVKNPGPGDTSNPYNLFSTVAFRLRAVAAVLNPSAGCLLISHEIPNL